MPTNFEIKRRVISTEYILLESTDWATVLAAIDYLKRVTGQVPSLRMNPVTHRRILDKLYEDYNISFYNPIELLNIEITNKLQDGFCMIVIHLVIPLQPGQNTINLFHTGT